MLQIGLTGGIGSGKSIVANVFAVLGIPVFSSDDASRHIMDSDEEVQQNITLLFGPAAMINGKPDKKYIASVVFNDAEKLKQLNALLHPATQKSYMNWHASQNVPYTIKESALLFESGTNVGLDFIIGVDADISTRVNRVMKRNGIVKEEVFSRIARQMDSVQKMLLCDFVVNNNGNDAILPQVLSIHNNLKSKA